MVNRTGQNHSIAKMDRTIKSGSVAPQVQYSTTSPDSGAMGGAFRNLASVLGEISTRFDDRLDIQAQAEANRAGAIAGTKDQLPSLQDETTIRGRAFNAAAKDTAIIRLDLQGREELNKFENDFTADPQKFRTAADAYLKGTLPAIEQFDPAMAQRFEAQYITRTTDAENRVKDRHIAIVRDRQLETAMRSNMAVQDEIAQDAASLFTGNPQDVQARFTKMIGNAGHLVDIANQVGPDGRALFSARERLAFEQEAENMVSEQVVQSWMRSQPDMVSAFKDWQDGKAEIVLSDDQGNQSNINLRDMLGERGYRTGGKAFMDTLRSELSMQSQIDAASDREFSKNSDALFVDMQLLAQEGQLNLSRVDMMRSQLEPDHFLTLTELAKRGGASVSNGKIYSNLAVADANGEDIRKRVRDAYAGGQLSRDDYVDLYNKNSGRIDKGAKDSITTGRDYLTQGLGALSKELGMVQSISIGQANAEYEISVQEFIDKNGRQPTHSEARDMAEITKQRFSVMSVGDSILALPLPASMSAAEKLNRNTSSQTIGEKMQKVNAQYLAKHGGNVSLRAGDPEFIKEMGLLKQYYDLMKLQEDGNARQSTSPK